MLGEVLQMVRQVLPGGGAVVEVVDLVHQHQVGEGVDEDLADGIGDVGDVGDDCQTILRVMAAVPSKPCDLHFLSGCPGFEPGTSCSQFSSSRSPGVA